MQLDRLAVNLQQQTPWEAIDLGFRLARTHFWILWRLWWLTALPITLLATVLLHEHPQWIGSLVWLFKPVFEPILLYWLSRALFRDELPFRSTRRHWWSITRRRLFSALTWRRLSPNRSLLYPVIVLENPSRQEWRQRTGIFTRSGSGATWLTILCVHFEAIIAVSLVAGIGLMIPGELLPDWDIQDWVDDTGIMAWVWSFASIAAMSLIAPFYVAGGFGLYLARRTELEAWDIEIAFRNLAGRVSGALSVLFVAGMLLIGSGASQHVHANGVDRETAKQTITEVLQDETFGKKQSITSWQYTGDLFDGEAGEADRLGDLGNGIAAVLEVLLWAGAVTLVAWSLFKIFENRSWLERFAQRNRTALPPRQPTVEQIVPELTDTLPDELYEAIITRLNEGAVRDALSLLYRGTLEHFMHRLHMDIGTSMTEQECLAMLSQVLPDNERAFFHQVTRQWIREAYGHRSVKRLDVESLLEDWLRITGPVS